MNGPLWIPGLTKHLGTTGSTIHLGFAGFANHVGITGLTNHLGITRSTTYGDDRVHKHPDHKPADGAYP